MTAGRARRIVIVGAGAAGCVLAARLTEDPGLHVTLLEAGADGDRALLAGPDALEAFGVADRWWPEVTVRRSAGAMPTPYRLGRGVGGSSAVNGMIATLGPRASYDEWARGGCDGWSSADLASAAARVALRRRRAALSELGAVDTALLHSGATASVSTESAAADAPFDDLGLGVQMAPLTRDDDGRRVSVVETYLDGARSRSNLELRPSSTAVCIVAEGGRAVGVDLANGEHIVADDVIVAAGAIHTPALLLRSGIDGAGAVGVGVQDHPAVTFTLRLREAAPSGRLAMGVMAGLSSSGSGVDLQLLAMNRVDDAGRYGALVLALLDVHSRGRVRLDDGSLDVDMRALSDERDLRALAAGVASTVRLLRSGAFDQVADAVFLDDRGTSLDTLGETEAEIVAWLAAATTSARSDGHFHAASSCRMGPAGDPGAVVDTRLRVRGVDGLRIVDASVFPRIPAANVHLPTVLVAERAAEIIRSGA